MKRTNTISFIVTLLVLSFIIMFAPAETSITERENRRVAQFPEMTVQSLLGGGFGKQFEEWLADQVGFRSNFIAASMSITKAMGVTPPTIRTPSTNGNEQLATTTSPIDDVNADDELTKETVSISEGNEQSHQAEEDESELHIDDAIDVPIAESAKFIQPEGVGSFGGWLLEFDDRIVEVFVENPNATERYCEILNQYRNSLGDNIRIFAMLVPTQIEFLPEMYATLGDLQIETIETAYSLLADGIIPVDAYEAITQHLDEYIYFRTDHHWTALGAYYGYEAFARAAEITPIPLSEYEVFAYPNFLGYLFNQSPSDILRENPDTIYAYSYKGILETSIPILKLMIKDESASYDVFLGGDHPSLMIDTSVSNGITAIIVKDSYANCFIPWLVPHYERLIVLDPRSFEGSVADIANSYDKIDLIFLNYALVLQYTDFIEKIFSILS